MEKRTRKPKNWIAGATSEHKGSFSRAAHKAGMSTAAYAEKEKNASGTLGRRARLAKTLMGMHK